jgi:hypothetical protein
MLCKHLFLATCDAHHLEVDLSNSQRVAEETCCEQETCSLFTNMDLFVDNRPNTPLPPNPTNSALPQKMMRKHFFLATCDARHLEVNHSNSQLVGKET